jgi:signal transduction histidine kinase
VAKHSGATQVQLSLAALPDGRLSLQVRDNGRGLHRDGRRSPLAFGLKGMTERVMALGGSLHIQGGPDGGTVVVVDIGRHPDEAAA